MDLRRARRHVLRVRGRWLHRPRVFRESDIGTTTEPVAPANPSVLRLPARSAHTRFRSTWPDRDLGAGRSPFFVCVTAPDKGMQTTAVIVEHHGETPETALWLTPHVRVPTSHPTDNQTLGAADTCWYRAKMGYTWASHSFGAQWDENFELVGAGPGVVTLTQYDPVTLQARGSIVNNSVGIETETVRVAGGEEFLFGLTRADVTNGAIHVKWNSPVAYLPAATRRSCSTCRRRQGSTSWATTRSR